MKIRERGLIHLTLIGFSSRFLRPRRMEWGWALSSAVRSSKPTTVGFGCRLAPTEGRFSILNCLPASSCIKSARWQLRVIRDDQDLRGEPIEVRKDALNHLLGADRAGLLISQPIDAPADLAFEHICQLGLEGIVSKKLGSRYESGRSSLWLRTINPVAPACRG